jgi:DNA repair exonuclease SbcCD ATPase subunit
MTRVIGDDTPSNRQTADDDTASSEIRLRVSELETTIEEQQLKLGFLRRKMTAQERVLADLSESGMSSPRIERLEEQLAWTVDELQHMSPRIEALTQVSDLAEQGSCPDCGTELSEEQSFADLGGPSAIECSNCDSVAGYRT